MGLSLTIGAVAGCAASLAVTAAPCQIKQVAQLQVETTNNRPIVDGTVDGQPVKILIDTGASITGITGALAKQLGLRIDPQSALHLYGVGGEKHVDATRIKKLQFGNFILTGLTVAVMSPQKSRATEAREGLFIVGSDLLSRYTVEFDFANHVMRFMMPEGCKPEQLVYWSRTFSMGEIETGRFDDTHIKTPVLLNGKRIDALLDTGAQVSWSTPYGARLAGVTNDAADHPVDDRLRGSNGERLPSFLGNFESISIGDDETVRNVNLWVADLFSADAVVATGSHLAKPVDDLPNLLIGCDFFLAHRLIASFKDHKLLFTYNGGPIFQAGGKPPAAADGMPAR
jgi:predicted aspartyl protease